ncbi:MAG: VWA domain-containing protein [Planctomycetia bacterium]|nr:VWA domain-containing protein [Planctomycetia bacterium]
MTLPRWQRRLLLLCRCSAFFCLLLAISGLTLRMISRDRLFIFLRDVSSGIDEQANRSAEDFLRRCEQMANGAECRTYEFSDTIRNTSMNAGNRPDDFPGRTDRHRETVAQTDPEMAIRVASAAVPPGVIPSIILLSDGNETCGNVLNAISDHDIPVSTVPLPVSDLPETQMTNLRLPDHVRQGEPFSVETSVQCNRDTPGKISIFQNGYLVADEMTELKSGMNKRTFQLTAEDLRHQEILAVVEAAEDTYPENNRATGFLQTSGKPHLLLIEKDPSSVIDFVAAMEAQKIIVDVRTHDGMPQTAEEYGLFDAVMISDVSATLFSMHQMELLRNYVRDTGGGLILPGGEESFASGEYHQTPLDDVIPVRTDREKEKENPSLALCLVIDRSGSMQGEKLELAKEAARGTIELLTPNDFVSVIAFNDVPQRIVPIQNVAGSTTMNQAIGSIEADGATEMWPAMNEALREMGRIHAKFRHVVLLTDGQSAPGDFESLARRMSSDQITVSTIGTGDADHDLLENIARIGHGRHYRCDDPRSIPQLFARETVLAGKSAIREDPFFPVKLTSADMLDGIRFEDAPPLLGLVIARPEPTSRTILASDAGDPLLTWWRYGLGVCTVFTSDIKGRWAADWLTWPDFPRFWAQVIRHTMRKTPENGDAVFRLLHEKQTLKVMVDVSHDDGRWLNHARGNVHVTGPDQRNESVPLCLTSPGRYEAVVSTPETGNYLLQVELHEGEKTIVQYSRIAVVGMSEELFLKPVNHSLLRQVAQLSGGVYNPTPEQVFAVTGSRDAWNVYPLRNLMLPVTLMLFVTELFLRRIRWPSGTKRST